jgi:hypothetical protein
VVFLLSMVFTSHTFADEDIAVEQTRGPAVAAGAAVVCLAATRGAAGGVGAMAETAVAARRAKRMVARMFATGWEAVDIEGSILVDTVDVAT